MAGGEMIRSPEKEELLYIYAGVLASISMARVKEKWKAKNVQIALWELWRLWEK